MPVIRLRVVCGLGETIEIFSRQRRRPIPFAEIGGNLSENGGIPEKQPGHGQRTRRENQNTRRRRVFGMADPAVFRAGQGVIGLLNGSV